MKNLDKVFQVISVGLIVAGFLLNTNRFLKAIELFKECLFLLRDRAGVIDEKLRKSFYKRIYFTMWMASSLMNDNKNTITYAEELLKICCESGERLEEYIISKVLTNIYLEQGKYAKAKRLSEKALLISKEIGDRNGEAVCYANLGNNYQLVGKYEEAREHLEKSLAINEEIGDINLEATCYRILGNVYQSVGDYEKAREYLEKSLAIYKDIGDRHGEATSLTNLGNVYESAGKYEKAREHLEKSLAIYKEIGDRSGEAACYGNFGNVYQSVGDYENAREHLEKSLAIQKEIGDRNGEAASLTNLGNVHQSVGDYENAREHLEKSLAIYKEIGGRNGEAVCYANLGNNYQLVGIYEEAKEHLEKSIAINEEIGDIKLEASCYRILGIVHRLVGEYEKAREHLEKSLAIQKDIGDRRGKAASLSNLGNVYQSVGDNKNAREHLEKSLAIQKDIGDRKGEANSLTNLGNVYESAGKYEKAREHLEKSLAIYKEIGDRSGEAACYASLGNMNHSVGEYDNASHCWEKALAISNKISDMHQIAGSYYMLGIKYLSLGRYSKANEYNQKALAIFKKIGDRKGVGSCHLSEGNILLYLGNLTKAKVCFENAFAINKEVGDKNFEARGCLNYGFVLFKQAEYLRAEEYIKKGLTLSQQSGCTEGEFNCLLVMAHLRLREGKIQEAISYFLSGIGKCGEMRGSLCDNDQFKISFLDLKITSYRELSTLLCEIGNPTEALYVLELSKARALADLISVRYYVENQISCNPQSLVGLGGIVAKGCNRTCLYVSYFSDSIYLWILNAGGVQHFRTINGNDLIGNEGLGQQLEEFFKFRTFGILAEDLCEDRSFHGFYLESKSSEVANYKRIGKENKADQGPKMNLPICYKLFINPVARFLEGPEITIVPDRALYQIPFAALTDTSGKYLSETFRIRVAPSLTVLKLINQSPGDYHSNTGALVVGNPDVGEVHFKGRLTNIPRLPCAENEARMVGHKLGVEPLLGQQATKQAVLQAMNSVALIHIAAHGDAEKGEIALAPDFRHSNRIPPEGLYLLTMSDISKVQLRAKLVVLSCCHSARGQTKAEGAVGIARAFLGSGARSVLVSLWALDDRATEQLMSRFYDHLVAGESAGESLHEAMKWMRRNG